MVTANCVRVFSSSMRLVGSEGGSSSNVLRMSIPSRLDSASARSTVPTCTLSGNSEASILPLGKRAPTTRHVQASSDS